MYRAAIFILTGLLAAVPSRAAVERGEILVDELSCARCHAPPGASAARILARPGPVLGQKGERLTPQWLRAYLANPDAVHPRGAMPDVLHGLKPADKKAAVEDLTHYLVSIQPPGDDRFEWDPSLIAAGRALYHTLGCVACHASFDPPARAAGDGRVAAEMQAMAENAAALPDLARKMSVPQLAAFLRDPVRFHPDGRMPGMRLTELEARSIAACLLRDQAPADAATQSVPGLKYEYFEKHCSSLPNFDRLKVSAVGTAPRFDLSARRRADDIAFRFRGNIEAPAQGEYQFTVESDDGAELLIDNKPVVNNDGIHAMREMNGRIVLSRGPHAVTLRYFNATGDSGLKVSWEGPGLAKQEIPGSALSHAGALMSPLGGGEFTINAARAARGKALFAQFRCAACHDSGEGAAAAAMAAAPALDALKLTRLDDCLSDNPAAGLPHYALGAEAREAVRQFLRGPEQFAHPLDAAGLVDRTIQVLDCRACHSRGKDPGPQDLRRQYFASTVEVDLGDEGRIPPRLDGVGAKLQESWMNRVLLEGASVRPYMATRMPQFGHDNVAFMPAALIAADDKGVKNPDLRTTSGEAKEGRRLLGVNGVGCIACHVFAGRPSLGVPALDLTTTTERLQTAWFRSYLLDPQSLRPGTRMPAFWPGGKASNRTILGGDADRQIDAIWTFLERGRDADLPDGLVHGTMELVADKTAIMYRNFIEGAGPRAIGVGYPEKANLAFDANDMRLALIWQGSFIDAAKHRTGRGIGTTPPMGHGVMTCPPGAPFAALGTPDEPWPAISGKAAGYQFRGYRLDEKMRPAFIYDAGPVHVTDYPVGVPGKDDAGIRRTFTFESAAPPANLYYRAAMANKIEPGVEPGSYVVEDRLTLKFGPQSGAAIRKSGGRSELIVPVRFAGGKASIEESYTW